MTCKDRGRNVVFFRIRAKTEYFVHVNEDLEDDVAGTF